MNARAGDETRLLQLLWGGLPILISIAAVWVSLCFRHQHPGWFARSGAVVVACGLVIGARAAAIQIKDVGGVKRVVRVRWYVPAAAILGIVGTLIWAFGEP